MEVVISNEADAWSWLERALSDDIPDAKDLNAIRFDGWPTINLKFAGQDFDSSVPTRLMPALLDAQREVHRLYSHFRYGDQNLRRVTADEREALELVVRVSPGSSEFVSELGKALTATCNAAVGKMTPKQIFVLALSLALTWGASASWKHWLSSQEAIAGTEARVALSREETARMQLLADAFSQHKEALPLASGIDEFRNNSLHKMKPGDSFSIPNTDVVVSGEHAAAITVSPRERSAKVDIDDAFGILGVDASLSRGFKIKVRRLSDGETMTVDIPDDSFTRDQLAIIQHSEWRKRPVMLQIETKVRRGKVVSGTLMSVKSIPDEDPLIAAK